MLWQANSAVEQILASQYGPLVIADQTLWSIQGDSLIKLGSLIAPNSKLIRSSIGLFLIQEKLERLRRQNDSWQRETFADSIIYHQLFPEIASDSSEPILCKWEKGYTAAVYRSGLRLYKDRKFLMKLPLPISEKQPKDFFISSTGTILLIGQDALFRLHSPWEHYFPRQLPLLSAGHANGRLYFSTALGLESLGQGFRKEKVEGLGLILSMCSFNGELILGTERGLVAYNPELGRQRNLGLRGFIFSLKADGDTLWVGSSEGIWTYQAGASKAQLQYSSERLEGASIFRIRGTGQSDLWFASYTGGIWRRSGGKLEKVDFIGDFPLDSISVSAFEKIDEEHLAFATLNQGLFLLNTTSGTRIHYDLKSLEFAEIRDLVISKEQLWLGTNKGLLAFNDVQQKVEGKERVNLHFFGGPVSSQGIVIKGDSLISAGDQGVYIWNIKAMAKQALAAKLGIIAIDLLGKEGDSIQDLAPGREAFSNIPLSLDLGYQQNYLRFNYSLRSLFYPQWVQYRYRLKGQSTSWTYAGSRREALFTDLKAGDYYFEVQARYPWQEWQMEKATYHFRIRTAFWRTWWFWTIVVLSFGSLAYLWLSDRYRRAAERLKLENELMEMERKALRLQMNPHFIFNALDSISSFIFKKDPKQAVRYLNNFAKLMRLTLESSMEHIHPVETEVSILKNYLELEKLRFSDKFDYQIEVDEEIDYDVGLPPMLIQPHVENAILHGIKPKEGSGFVKISFSREGNQLCCIVDDDGIGRVKAKDLPGKKAHRSMATQINKDRIDLLRRSSDELIDLEVIDKYNQAGKATGTTVIIRLPAQEL